MCESCSGAFYPSKRMKPAIAHRSKLTAGSPLWFGGRFVRLLQSALGRRLYLRQSCPRRQRRAVFIHRPFAVLFHVQDSSQVHMRPSHHFGILGRLDRFLEILQRAFAILIGHRHLRQDEQGSSFISNFLIQSLLG